MRPVHYHFEDFTLDPVERQLRRGGELLEVNGRYFDALALMIGDAGKLVSKDRFLEQAWNGIPVTEEALTQCIRTLRKQLGDSATNPRFIETIPKHGYRFIAPVVTFDAEVKPPASALARETEVATAGWSWRQTLLLAAAGITGAGISGVLGGLFYGFAGASQPLAPGMGAASMLLVMVSLTIVAAVAGGAGVSLGIAASALLPGRRWRWAIAGGALGGLLVGAMAKLLGLDAFNLLLGRSPGDITGGAEGLLLGGAVGFGIWFGGRNGGSPWTRRSVAAAAVAGAITGMVIPVLGGRMLGGSLDLLAHSFPNSRLRLDQIGVLLGEPGFGPISQAATGALEGALFGACIVGAMVAFAPLFARGLPEQTGRQ
ncbi:MAG: transcriptional regulator [Thermomonas sp.]